MLVRIVLGLPGVDGVGSGIFDRGGFGAEDAAEPPVLSSDLGYEQFFANTLRSKLGREAGEEVVEFIGMLITGAGSEEIGGEDAMGDGITGGDGFASGSTGAGRAEGVGAIGGELFLGDGHGGSPSRGR